MDKVDETLSQVALDSSGRDKLICVHGNRFVLFCVFSRMREESLRDDAEITPHLQQAERLTRSLAALLISQVNEAFPDAYPGNIFKNQDRQVDLLTSIANKKLKIL